MKTGTLQSVPISKQIAQPKFDELGSPGLRQFGGILEEEFLRELRGPRGVNTFREMSKNDAVVGASLFAYTTLAKEVTFRVDSAIPGDRKADEIAEFIRSALFEDMAHSWSDLLGEIYSFLTYGWSFFEVVFKRRLGDNRDPSKHSRFNDGRVGWRKWAVRGQDTLVKWLMDDHGGTQGMVQRAAPKYVETEIPIDRALLFRTLVERNGPEGVSILRTAYQPFYYKRRLQIVRGIGIERDLAGLPVLTPPENTDVWNPSDPQAVALRANAERLVRNIRRDEHEGVLKPYGWTLELLSSSGGRQFDITDVIAQLNSEIAMSMLTDFLLVGHEKVGARNVSMEKRQLFSKGSASFLNNICTVINRFAVPQLVRLNGWPVELSPKVAHGPVAEIELGELTTFIEKAAGAGLLFPDAELEKHLRERAQLPPPPEDRGEIPRPPSDDRSEEEEEEEEESDEDGQLVKRNYAVQREMAYDILQRRIDALEKSNKETPSSQTFNISPPVVNFTPPNVDVHVQPPNVAVHLAKAADTHVRVQAPDIHVAAPDVHVAAPTVHVSPPDVKVDVHVPKPSGSRVLRDERGRIAGVEPTITE